MHIVNSPRLYCSLSCTNIACFSSIQELSSVTFYIESGHISDITWLQSPCVQSQCSTEKHLLTTRCVHIKRINTIVFHAVDAPLMKTISNCLIRLIHTFRSISKRSCFWSWVALYVQFFELLTWNTYNQMLELIIRCCAKMQALKRWWSSNSYLNVTSFQWEMN